MDVGQIHLEHIEITAQMVKEFARLSGDFNPLHLDPEYARTTSFKKPIAQCMLGPSLMSGIIGTRFPGNGTALVESEMHFFKPLFVGEVALFRLSVEHVRPDKPVVTLLCEILNPEGEIASSGQFVVSVFR